MTDASGFDDLGPEEKVKFSEAEIAATLAKLDDAIARMAALRTEVEDPDGLIRFTLGDDEPTSDAPPAPGVRRIVSAPSGDKQ